MIPRLEPIEIIFNVEQAHFLGTTSGGLHHDGSRLSVLSSRPCGKISIFGSVWSLLVELFCCTLDADFPY